MKIKDANGDSVTTHGASDRAKAFRHLEAAHVHAETGEAKQCCASIRKAAGVFGGIVADDDSTAVRSIDTSSEITRVNPNAGAAQALGASAIADKSAREADIQKLIAAAEQLRKSGNRSDISQAVVFVKAALELRSRLDALKSLNEGLTLRKNRPNTWAGRHGF
jgi:hypothetical protein